ncbi:MAG: hypothetical protein ABI705_07805 [Aestuariivirga sp.]
MKNFYLGLVALTAAFVAPALTTTAAAHPVGDVCRYKSVDSYGDVRNGSDYCHHLPDEFQDEPRPGLNLYFNPGAGYYFDNQPRFRRTGNPQQQVCLVTFFKRSQVAAGADVNVQRAQLLPRRAAERLDRPNDRNRIFVYGSDRQTRQTCRYLNRLNNNEQGNGGPGNDERLVCLVTFFSRDQVQGGADADVERARVLPSREAQRLDGPNDRNRIFSYGSPQKTRETCRYLNGINN